MIDMIEYAESLFLRGARFQVQANENGIRVNEEYCVCPQCGEDVEIEGNVCDFCSSPYHGCLKPREDYHRSVGFPEEA